MHLLCSVCWTLRETPRATASSGSKPPITTLPLQICLFERFALPFTALPLCRAWPMPQWLRRFWKRSPLPPSAPRVYSTTALWVAMRLEPARKQIGFVVEQPSVPAETSCPDDQHPQSPSPPPVSRYEPLYIVSYGSPGTPASQGTWCIVMADEIPDSSGRKTFSLHGMFRQIGVAKKNTIGSTDAPVKSRKRRVTFLEPEPSQLTRKDSKRRKTYPDTTRTSTSPPPMSEAERLRILNTHHVRDEVRRFALRSSEFHHSVEYTLKNATTISDCLQDPLAATAPFNEGQIKVLGVIEIAQLPLNVDVVKKRRVLEKIRLELWHGKFRGVPLEEARREWVMQVINDLAREWRVAVKGVPDGLKATEQSVARLFDSQTANL
ncbi:hypothetical protein NMY22_g13204 [Coprinellus aureogranulatus]|nr:hypothetical protein NMY22_g13204 [Coprinellus aureogranulatus]